MRQQLAANRGRALYISRSLVLQLEKEGLETVRQCVTISSISESKPQSKCRFQLLRKPNISSASITRNIWTTTYHVSGGEDEKL